MRDIIIRPALNGFVVRMGCQRIVFVDRDVMIRALNDYLDEPSKTEERYTLNSMHSKQFGFTRPCSQSDLGGVPAYEPVCESSYED